MRIIPSPLYLFVLFCCDLLLPLCTSSSGFNTSSQLHLAESSPNKTRAHCMEDWISGPSDTKCFRHFMYNQSWEASEAKCKSYNGHLAAVTSSQELSFVQQLCAENASGCWIGGRGLKTEAGVSWNWSDNSSYFNETMISRQFFSSVCKKPACNGSNLLNLCSLVASETSYISPQSCNVSHTFICMLDAGNKCRHMHCHREYLIILFSVSGLIVGITLIVVVWLLVIKPKKRRRRSRKLSSTTSSASASPSWKVFTREELKSITKNFSEGSRLLGDAKTGGTYSGVLPDGSRVAVKRLKRSSFQRKKEFYSETGKLARLHHPNLVAVKGCCYDHGDRFIVYEFIVNGPLDRWLHHIPRGGRSLDWAMRIKVATTLAKGIAFLHDKLKPQVVHLDIRASNVLLDEEFGAHLMGVGLSKFVPWEVMHERRVVAGGTHGYLAPEFVYRNELTTKSDVYSFGVLLLEIISGRKPSQAVDSMGWQSIFEWATPLVQLNRYPELLDPLITSSSPQIPDSGVIQKVVDLVYSCTQHVPSMRPRMSHVFHQLQQLSQPSPMK